jgi:putative flippase GtrA
MRNNVLELLSGIDPKTKRQIIRFLFAGCGAVGTDTFVYFMLVHNYLNYVGYNWAKFIAFISGTFTAFIINKYWTFESKQKSLFEVVAFMILYFTTLGLNVSVNHIILYISGNLTILAFVVATGCSTVANFLGQKFWVFKVAES